jgi:hypothetical protein
MIAAIAIQRPRGLRWLEGPGANSLRAASRSSIFSEAFSPVGAGALARDDDRGAGAGAIGAASSAGGFAARRRASAARASTV